LTRGAKGNIVNIVTTNQKIMSAELKMPVCPICKTEMYVIKYEGYYESFKFWECECSDEELPKEKFGATGAYCN
jgi:hypothetical protein